MFPPLSGTAHIVNICSLCNRHCHRCRYRRCHYNGALLDGTSPALRSRARDEEADEQCYSRQETSVLHDEFLTTSN